VVQMGDRRGEVVAALGVVVGLGAFVALVLLGIANNSVAVFSAAWHALGSVGIWILILIHLHQLRLVEQERLEIAEMERERRERLGGAGSIFEEEDAEQMEALAMGRRLRAIEKWFIPIFAMITAGYLALCGARMIPGLWPIEFVLDAPQQPLRNPSMMAFFAGAFAFVCFALSRYALGMSRVEQVSVWGALRSGGGYFFGMSIVGLATAIALVLAHNGYVGPERWLGKAIGGLMIFLAAEIIVNYVLDLYRPRVPGAVERVFYESRFLNLFSEPEGIIRSAAQAIDYQFGFKVSETWFYRLLGRAVVPLLLFQAVVIYLITCFVVVPPGYQAVIEVMGTGQSRRSTADTGVTWTWPWPFARSTLIPVDRIQRIELGYEKSEEERLAGEHTGPILWTEKHRAKEYQLLVADRDASRSAQVPVNLLSVAMPIHWRIKRDYVLQYHAQATEVEEIIESLAYRELTRYAAHTDLFDLMGPGGIEAVRALRDKIQAACDRGGVGGQDLGVEIVHIGLGSVHPPVEVAAAYEDVINAHEQSDTKVRQGRADAIETQITAAGERFRLLYDAIVAEEQARDQHSPDLSQRTLEVESMFREVAAGEARRTSSQAEGYLYERVTLEEAAADLFKIQQQAFEQAPGVYTLRLYLDMLVRSLTDRWKYVVAVNDPDRVIYQLDLKPPPRLEVLRQELERFQEGGGR
jgi:membrane protease subunit HflK